MENQSAVMIARRVCVVGASGRVGSWLVKKLLERGHIVHATIRNIHDPEKAGLVKRLQGADSRLHLFEADLFHPHQIDQAIHGCEFVFLVAFPTKPFNSDAERDAAAEGVLAILQSVLSTCERSGTVKRLIYTGSVVTTSPLDEQGLFSRDLIDESCWTKPDAQIPYPSDFAKFYTSIKTASEELLASYGVKEGELEVVILDCGVVGGDALVDSVFGVRSLLSPLIENTALLANFVFLQNLLHSVPLVHLDDACEAHLFCMDVPLTSGSGRFLCASDYPSVGEIMAYYRRKYPELIALEPEVCGSNIKGGSSKLTDMGFEYKYSMEQILDESIKFARKLGLIKDR
ncbi:hypothetical protein Taro_043700 [Colocasia esculenta]|uniref:NAD-dependent epimerase/dehydratase domain-containing protein n=1 Tax=Colocasia esculenta TaxID=4460 RepID=A0A843X4G4_COLES|nr:hypothetical protein [Colocasia esculenta]